MDSLFQELKRRKVFRVASVYTIVAWLIIQVAGEILPTFEAPDWVNQTLVLVLVLGFPLAVVLAWAFEVTPEGIKPDAQAGSAAPASPPTDRYLTYAILSLVLLIIVIQLSDRFLGGASSRNSSTDLANASVNGTGGSGTAARPSRRFLLPLGEAVELTAGARSNLVLSPDGNRLIFGLSRPLDDGQYLHQLDLNSFADQRLGGGAFAAFSPDGRWIAYVSREQLYKMPAIGGSPLPLALQAHGPLSWGIDDRVYFPISSGAEQRRRLARVSADGGEVEILTDEDDEAWLHMQPQLLPDGETVLFAVYPRRGDTSYADVALLDLASGSVETIIPNARHPYYVPTGHILFLRSGALFALPFDLEQLQTTGLEVQIVDGIVDEVEGVLPLTNQTYSLSDDGLFVYLAAEEETPTRLNSVLVVNRDGSERRLATPEDYRGLKLSPDGEQLAVVIRDNELGQEDIWIYDLERGSRSRLSFNPANDNFPLWTPDGTHIVFQSERDGGGIWIRAANGTGSAEPILNGYGQARPTGINPEGTLLVFESNDDIYLLSLEDEAEPEPLLQTQFDEQYSVISPDGKWIAYDSDESGRREIYVQPFPDVERGRLQVSNRGGSRAVWSKQGSELLFHSNSIASEAVESNVFSVTVIDSDIFRHEPPQLLFSGSYDSNYNSANVGRVDVSTNGDEIYMISADRQDMPESLNLYAVALDNFYSDLLRSTYQE